MSRCHNEGIRNTQIERIEPLQYYRHFHLNGCNKGQYRLAMDHKEAEIGLITIVFELNQHDEPSPNTLVPE